MKKIISILLLFVLVFSLSGCEKGNNTSSELDTSVQSDVSSTVTSSESTTTSEENSTSTPSANTTPSNTTPINSTPSNSTPSKTEEPKPTVVLGEYTVTFDYGYDNIKTTTKSKNYKVAKPNNPVRNGYEFLGWYAENEDTPWNFAGHMVTTDMMLTAKWWGKVVSNSSPTKSSTTLPNTPSDTSPTTPSDTSPTTSSDTSPSVPSN